MTKRQQGIPLRPNVVIKPQFILDKFQSNDDDEGFKRWYIDTCVLIKK
jgi:hypothetical protein